MGIILMGHFSSESATVRRYGHFCVAVGAVGAVGLLSELSERGMTVTAHGHCRVSLSGCRSCCRTTVGLLSDYCRTVGLCRTPVGSYCRPVGPGLRVDLTRLARVNIGRQYLTSPSLS